MGIIAKVSSGCAEVGVNIIDISQSVLRSIRDDHCSSYRQITVPFTDFVDNMTRLGRDNALRYARCTRFFNSMTRIIRGVASVNYNLRIYSKPST